MAESDIEGCGIDAGQIDSMVALNSAPTTIANPRKNAKSRNAIGVASAP
jgi:hypothetical protein